MPAILLYLLKVNVALVLFYLAYEVTLRRLTFYHLNRLFLVFGIVFSTVYPFIDLSEIFAEHKPIAEAYIVTIPDWVTTTQSITQTPTFDYWLVPVYMFWAGVIVMLIRFILQLASLYKLHASSEPVNYSNISFRKVKSINHAFSFWQTIYLNPEQHKREELESILRHELIHITGWHTLDVLLAELSTVFYWFNPGAWLMKKAVKENLEFIADQQVVQAGIDKKEYQYLLLKVVGATQPQIANQFNFPSLKRRIAMMNKKQTSKANRLRLLIVLPIVTLLLFAFRNAAPLTENSAVATKSLQQKDDVNLPKELVKRIKQNPDVKSVRGKIINNRTAVVISFKGGGTKVYYLDDAQSIAELERQYSLPELPPPPPPAPDAPEIEDLPAPPPAPEAPALPAPPPPVKKEEATLKMNLPDGVVYYIDGKEDKSAAYHTIDPKEIHSINVYKGESAQKMLGDRAAKGVISIITKKNKDSEQVKEFAEKFASGTKTSPSVNGTSTATSTNPKSASRIAFALHPDKLSQAHFNAATEHFKKYGFDVDIKEVYDGAALTAVSITTKSKNNTNNLASYYSIAELKARKHVIIVTADEATGKVANSVIKMLE